ncbi:MAG: hypothetical protein MUE94_03870 [Verrucomicrobia bacterium]|jgi:hypothetical protein|nr:hypothetical protein [Verrucomicrobiota bacterium]
MSLIRFLSSGSRGLTKGAPPLGRYRLPDGRVIPDFGGGKNPFASKTLPAQEEPAVGVTAKAALTQAAPPSPAVLPQGADVLSRWARKGRSVVESVRSRLPQVSAAGFGLPRLLEGVKRFPQMALQALPRKKAPVRFAATASARVQGPLQGELSLENVRVVRNDLTDTDYEVVCSETATASPVKRVPQTVPLIPQSRPLGRLAERLFSQKAH